MMNAMVQALARRTGESGNRRLALKSLAAVALATAATPLATQAKKGNKNASKKKAQKLCRRQVGQCEAAVRVTCAGSAECEADLIPCCLELGQCDATGFIACVSSPDGGNPEL
jgi:hypothetical protein